MDRTPCRLLYVEDEEVIRENYSEFFEEVGFVVTACETAGEVSSLLSDGAMFDIAVLDMQLKEDRFAGINACAELRESQPLLPIVMLTMHDDHVLEEICYKNGADAFVSKQEPISLLITRLKTLLQRYKEIYESRADSIDISELGLSSSGDLAFEDKQEIARWKGQTVELNPIRFAILKVLVQEDGEAVSAYDVMSKLSLVVEPNTVVQHIKMIRSAFVKVDPSFDRIITVRGKGYRWI